MSRKRMHALSNDLGNLEPRQKKIRAWDSYCWECHKHNTNRRCSMCIRSYHNKCIANPAKNSQDYLCELCVRTDAAQADYEARNVDRSNMNKMLGLVTQRLFDDFGAFDADFSNRRRPASPGQDIINPFDLTIVKEKVDDTKYLSTLEYVSDIRWIRHNAEIVLKRYDNRLERARFMEELCEKEVYDIEMCSPCFHRSLTMNKWFTQVCDPPHLVVWAMLKGHPFWPAKVIGTSNQATTHLDVRFFGKHERANVLTVNCLLFGDNPNKKLNDQSSRLMASALKEVDTYLKNIKHKYSCKIVRPKRSQLVKVGKIDRYLMDMIPELQLDAGYKLPVKPEFLRKVRRRKTTKQPEEYDEPNEYDTANLSDHEDIDSSKDYADADDLHSVPVRECVVRLQNCDHLIAHMQHNDSSANIEPHQDGSVERLHDSLERQEILEQILDSSVGTIEELENGLEKIDGSSKDSAKGLEASLQNADNDGNANGFEPVDKAITSAKTLQSSYETARSLSDMEETAQNGDRADENVDGADESIDRMGESSVAPEQRNEQPDERSEAMQESQSASQNSEVAFQSLREGEQSAGDSDDMRLRQYHEFTAKYDLVIDLVIDEEYMVRRSSPPSVFKPRHNLTNKVPGLTPENRVKTDRPVTSDVPATNEVTTNAHVINDVSMTNAAPVISEGYPSLADRYRKEAEEIAHSVVGTPGRNFNLATFTPQSRSTPFAARKSYKPLQDPHRRSSNGETTTNVVLQANPVDVAMDMDLSALIESVIGIETELLFALEKPLGSEEALGSEHSMGRRVDTHQLEDTPQYGKDDEQPSDPLMQTVVENTQLTNNANDATNANDPNDTTDIINNHIVEVLLMKSDALKKKLERMTSLVDDLNEQIRLHKDTLAKTQKQLSDIQLMAERKRQTFPRNQKF